MKKAILFFLLMAFLLSLAACFSAKPKVKLSELPYGEQISFLENAGVVFPEGFPPEQHMDFISGIIRQAEDGSYTTPVLSNPLALEAADEIAAAVKEYYGD